MIGDVGAQDKVRAPQEQKCEARVEQKTNDEFDFYETIDDRRCEVKRKRNVAKKSLISQAESKAGALYKITCVEQAILYKSTTMAT